VSASEFLSPLDNVHGEYFDLLNEYFGGIYITGANKFLQARRITEMKLAAKIIIQSVDDLNEDICAFWDKNANTVISHLQHSVNFRANYCGTLSPLDGYDFVKRTALYVDSILIEDPLIMITQLKDLSEDNAYLSRMIEHVFNLIDMKELFFGLGDYPVLTIFPPFRTERNRQEIMNAVNASGLKYFETLMEAPFSDIGSFFEYMKNIKDLRALSEIIKHPQMLPKSESQSHPEFLQEVYERITGESKVYKDASVGETLALKVLGQLTAVGTESFNSAQLSAQMVFDSSIHWKMYKWGLTNDFKQPDIDNVIINSLQLDEFKWLGNVPMNKLLQMRREGELSSLRSLIGKNIYSSTHASADLEISAKQAMSNIEDALIDHSKELSLIDTELRKKYLVDSSMAVLGVVSGLVSGPLSPLSLVGLSSSLYGMYDLGKGIASMHKKKDKLASGVIGMLLQAKKGGGSIEL